MRMSQQIVEGRFACEAVCANMLSQFLDCEMRSKSAQSDALDGFVKKANTDKSQGMWTWLKPHIWISPYFTLDGRAEPTLATIPRLRSISTQGTKH